MKIVELTRETWPELETLFGANKTATFPARAKPSELITSSSTPVGNAGSSGRPPARPRSPEALAGGGCWCVWFMRPHKEVQAGWGADNREVLRSKLGAPLGLLAIDEDVPIGWVAVAPRPAYPRLATSKITASGGGPETWAVTCFFVHPTARRRGLAGELLDAAVDFAVSHGARAVEAFPVDTEGARRLSGDLFHGTLAMFLAAGFTLVERRSTRRVLVRKELP